MSKVRVRDLPDTAGPKFLLCRVRPEHQYSATARDYFAADPELVIRCCGRPVRLVVEERTFKEVQHGVQG